MISKTTRRDVKAKARISFAAAADALTDVLFSAKTRASPVGLLLSGGARFTIGFLAARAVIFGELAPFGVAYMAASAGSRSWWWAVCGTIGGYLSLVTRLDYMKYIAAAAIIAAAFQILRGVLPAKRDAFPPIAALTATAAVGIAYAAGMGFTSEVLVRLAGELVTTAAAAWFFRCALPIAEGGDEERTRICRVFTAAVMCASLISVSAADISAGRALAAAVTLIASYSAGERRAAAGTVAGVTTGLACDVASVMLPAPFYVAVFGLSGLISGIFGRFGKIVAAMTFITCGAASSIWLSAAYGGQTGICALYENMMGAAIFLAFPMTAFSRVTRMRPAAKAAERTCASQTIQTELLRGAAGKTLEGAAEAYAAINAYVAEPTELAPQITPPKGLYDKLLQVKFQHAADELKRVTRGQYEAQAELLSSVVEIIKTGYVFENALSEQISAELGCETCIYSDASGRMMAELRFADGEAKDAAELLDTLRAATARPLEPITQSGDGAATSFSFGEKENFYVRVETDARRRTGSDYSGDCGTWFRCGAKFYLLLSDGMGSGRDAAVESARTLQVTEKFLRAGCGGEETMKLVTAAIKLKNSGALFATLDMAEINLMDGKAAFYKAGAPPSYVRRADGEVIRLGGEAPAFNMADEPECTRMTLLDGDTVFLVSDGAGELGDASSAAEIIARADGSDDTTAAAITLSRSQVGEK